MKTMILSDFTIIKSSIPQQLFIGVVIAFALCFGMSSAFAIIPAVTFAGAFSIIFTVIALDESNGWERYRLSLPLSRAQIIRGRYASTLLYTLAFMIIGVVLYLAVIAIIQSNIFPIDDELVLQISTTSWESTVLICMISFVGMLGLALLVLPLTSRFGLTKAARLLPLAVIFLMVIASWAISLSGTEFTSHINNFFAQISTPEGIIIALLVSLAATLTLYAISCLVATKLYAKREF